MSLLAAVVVAVLVSDAAGSVAFVNDCVVAGSHLFELLGLCQ